MSGDKNVENGSSPGFCDQINLEKIVGAKKDAQQLKEKMSEYGAELSEIKLKLDTEDNLNTV